MKPTALERAVAAAGSQSALARICGVSQPAVFGWLKSGKAIPAEYALAVEAATSISRHELRPDLYPLDPSPVAAASCTAGETIAAVNSSDANARDDQPACEPELPIGSPEEPELPIAQGLAA